MSEPLHIMIGSEHGTLRTFTLSRKCFFITLPLSVIIVIIFATTSFFTLGSFTHNRLLVNKMTVMKKNLIETENANNEYRETITRLGETVTHLENNTQEKIAALQLETKLLLTSQKLENSQRIADLEMKNLQQEASFKEERDHLLSTAVNELNERNELIESVMKNIGIKVTSKKGKTSTKNSGGPYIAIEDSNYDELIYKADAYLKTLRTLPLGRPVTGPITSRYGRRIDPLKHKKAFHSGIDFRGKRGAKICATANGKVVFAGRNGSYGNFIKINHNNGYVTSFAHLQNYHVKKGDYVTRGQVIGLVGNSGRSTGPHLHYEVAYRGKTINPYKFMKF